MYGDSTKICINKAAKISVWQWLFYLFVCFFYVLLIWLGLLMHVFPIDRIKKEKRIELLSDYWTTATFIFVFGFKTQIILISLSLVHWKMLFLYALKNLWGRVQPEMNLQHTASKRWIFVQSLILYDYFLLHCHFDIKRCLFVHYFVKKSQILWLICDKRW